MSGLEEQPTPKAELDDARLGEWLRSLPREEASPRFTAGVLARIDAVPRERASRRLTWLAAAAALLMVVGGGVVLRHAAVEAERASQRQAAIERLQALEQEKSELESELAQLARLTRRARPVLYVDTLHLPPRRGTESSREVDLVIDLAALAERRSATPASTGPASAIPIPANYQGDPR